MRVRVGCRGRFGAGLIVATFSFLSCSQEEPPGPAQANEQPLQITRDFSTTESDSGVVRFVFRARIARTYSGDVVRAEDIEVDFFDRGSQVSELRALRGFLDPDGRMRAQGEVVVVSEEGAVLETEELFWDRDNKKIRSDEFVRLTKGRDVLTGYGLTTGPNLELVEIDQDVRATVIDDAGAP